VEIAEGTAGSGAFVSFKDNNATPVDSTLWPLYIYTATPYTPLGLETQAGLDAYLAGMSSWTGPNSTLNMSFGEQVFFTVSSATDTSVPEPASGAILMSAMAGLGWLRRRRA
jgi:hypothetical protein